MRRLSLLAAPLVALLAACASSPAEQGKGGGAPTASGTRAVFDWSADLGQGDHFYDAPYPSDLRLNASGGPDMKGLPIPSAAHDLMSSLQQIAGERRGFPVIPVAYFRFDGPIAAGDLQKP